MTSSSVYVSSQLEVILALVSSKGEQNFWAPSRCSVLLIGQQYRLIVVVCVAFIVDYTTAAY
jgi:hypothetical protein